MVKQLFTRRGHSLECLVGTDVFIALPFHSICLKVGAERSSSEVIITGTEEWAKLNRCNLMGNSVKLLCDSKANDTSMELGGNSFTRKSIEEIEDV